MAGKTPLCAHCGEQHFGGCPGNPHPNRPGLPWQKVWHEGFAPLISTAGLLALKKALEDDDTALIQGDTCQPMPLPGARDAPAVGACALGYCGWQGEGLGSLAEVDEYFARLCAECDQRLGVPAASRDFVEFYDWTSRAEMRVALLAEVVVALARRLADDPPSE